MRRGDSSGGDTLKGGGWPSSFAPEEQIAFLPDNRRLLALASHGYYVFDPVSGVLSKLQAFGIMSQAFALSADGRWAVFAQRGSVGRPIPTFKFVPGESLQVQA